VASGKERLQARHLSVCQPEKFVDLPVSLRTLIMPRVQVQWFLTRVTLGAVKREPKHASVRTRTG
jgi:hypothetical protein